MKPTLFLSHAAKDARPIGKLKSRLVDLTGSAIEIFLSSDGQSIPFGRNWVHAVEEALQRAKLMYVFLSPAALESKWIPFEAGYVYSKGIRVVPVGVMGVDLAQVGPPLSLLQGFNIGSGSAMNNLVKIINDTFEYSFGETLGQDEYGQIFYGEQLRSASLFGRHSGWIDEILFYITCIHDSESRAVVKFLDQRGIACVMNGRQLSVPGMSFPLYKGTVDIRVDAGLSAINFPLIEDLVPFMIGDSSLKQFSFEIQLKAPVRAVEGIHRLGARVFGTDLELSDGGNVAFGPLLLKLHQNYESVGAGSNLKYSYDGVRVEVLCQSRELSKAPFAYMLNTLFEVGALFFDS